MDVRTVWKGVGEDVVSVLSDFSPFQWLILERMWAQGRFEGCEINAEGLLQSFEKSKMSEAKKALEELVRRTIIHAKKKPNTWVYQADPHLEIFVSGSPHVKVYQKIREDGTFRKMWLNGEIEVSTVDDGIRDAVDSILKKYKGGTIADYSILPLVHDRSDADGAFNIKLTIVFYCPRNDEKICMQPLVFKIQELSDIYTGQISIQCQVCRRKHMARSNGRIA